MDVTKKNVNRGSKKSSNLGIALTPKETRLTKSVITVDAIFIICNVPKCMVLVISVLGHQIKTFKLVEQGIYSNVISVVIVVAYTLETVNAAFTFVIYYLSSFKFRSVCRQIFCNPKVILSSQNRRRNQKKERNILSGHKSRIHGQKTSVF